MTVLKLNAAAFIKEFNLFSLNVHANAVSKGWWETERRILSDFEDDPDIDQIRAAFKVSKVTLVSTEVSEAIEAIRRGNPKDDKIPQFDNMTVELADAVIRIMDLAQSYNLPVAEVIVAKHNFNTTRQVRHGGKLL